MRKTWADRLLYNGAFFGFFDAHLLFVRGPAANQQQQLFRVGLALLGFVLGVTGLILKATSGRA